MATDPPPPYPGPDASNPEPKPFDSCPNGCKTGALTQGQLRWHQQHCPLQLVECEFANAGCCDVKVPRRDLDRHMTEYAQHHLMSATLLNVKRIKALHQELNQKMEEKDRQIADLQKQVEKLSNRNGFTYHNLVLRDFTAQQGNSPTGEWYSKVFSDEVGTLKLQLKIDTNGARPGLGHMTATLYRSDLGATSRLSSHTYVLVSLHMLNQIGDYGHHVVMDYTRFQNVLMLTKGEKEKDKEKFFPLADLGYNSKTKTQYLVNDSLHFKLYFRIDFGW